MAEEHNKDEMFKHLHPSLELEETSIQDIEMDIYMDNVATGYWLLTYPKTDLDAAWLRAVYLYRSRELDGICSIKTSTAAPNPRLPDENFGEVRFKCGPYAYKDTVIEYGKIVVSKMNYCSENGFAAYKTSLQIYKGNEDGNDGDPLYTLEVPNSASSSERNITANGKSISENSCEFCWELSYAANVNGKWRHAVELHRRKKLVDIMSIDMTYTSAPTFTGSSAASGKIFFLCCPLDGRNEALKCGKQLLEQMGESESFRSIKFITEAVTSLSLTREESTLEDSSKSSEVDVTLRALTSESLEEQFTDLIPSKEKEELYLDDEVDFLLNEYSLGGLWMLFYPNDLIDEKWQLAISLYRAREFPRISLIECTSGAPTHRTSEPDKKVIFFKSNMSSEDEEEVLNSGRAIVEKMKYTSTLGHVSYKTYIQGFTGTRATGVKVNHLYKIPVPYTNSTQKNPRQQGTKSFGIIERTEEIASLYPTDTKELGTWEMILNRPWYDQFWKKACSLYQENELPGIAYLKQSPDNQESRTRAILFFGPWLDQELTEKCGRSLAEKVEYFNRDGKMFFKTFQEDKRKILYTIEVPTTFSRK